MNDKLKEVSLTEMLDAREARAFAQKQLLNRYQKASDLSDSQYSRAREGSSRRSTGI